MCDSLETIREVVLNVLCPPYQCPQDRRVQCSVMGPTLGGTAMKRVALDLEADHLLSVTGD